jgi:O-antigen/teichoic acid export membrane protein
MYGDAKAELVWVTLYCIFTAYISRFLSLILRMQERGIAYSMSQIIPKFVMLLAVCTIVLAGINREFLNLQLAFLISTSTVLFIYAWNTRNEWLSAARTKIDPASTVPLLKFGVPLVFSGVIYWGLIATSTLTLRIYAPMSELGLYSVTASFAAVAGVFQSIFTVIWAPTVYKWQAENVDMTKVSIVSNQVLMTVCLICALCGMFSWITDYLLPEQYSSVKYLLLCSLIPPLMYTLSEVTSIGIGITKRTHFSIWATLIAFSANVILSINFVPAYGAAGAVVSNAIAYVIFFTVRTEFSSLIWQSFSRVRIYVFVNLLLVLSILTIICAAYDTTMYAYMWLFFLCFSFICFNSDAKSLWKEIKLR